MSQHPELLQDMTSTQKSTFLFRYMIEMFCDMEKKKSKYELKVKIMRIKDVKR